MRKDKNTASELRKSGKSYSEISTVLSVPRSTLSGWFGKEDWSKEIKEKLSKSMQEVHTIRIKDINRERGSKLELSYAEARKEAQEEFEKLKYNPLFIAAIMLYWGEGNKANRNTVKITNTDPQMIKLYVFFLRACLESFQYQRHEC